MQPEGNNVKVAAIYFTTGQACCPNRTPRRPSLFSIGAPVRVRVLCRRVCSGGKAFGDMLVCKYRELRLGIESGDVILTSLVGYTSRGGRGGRLAFESKFYFFFECLLWCSDFGRGWEALLGCLRFR